MQSTLDKAEADLNTAVAAGSDPRPFRPAVSTARQELADVDLWVKELSRRHAGACEALATCRAAIERPVLARHRAELPGRRTALRERAAAMLAEVAVELETIRQLERLFASKR